LCINVLAAKHLHDQFDSTHINHGQPEVLCMELVSSMDMQISLIVPCSTVLLRRYSVEHRALSSWLSSILMINLTAPASIMAVCKFSAWHQLA
jgi:hypothetical protein